MQKQSGNRQRGEAAEQVACLYLQRRGLKLLCKNYRCRRGEIDLVMCDGDLLVFVEVRMRNHSGYGGAAASVNKAKQRRLLCTAAQYLQEQPLQRGCRFDVVEVRDNSVGGTPGQSDGVANWIRNAFTDSDELF